MIDFESKILRLEKEILMIKERNAVVEKQKKRETSFIRKLHIVVFTYWFMTLLFYLLWDTKFYIQSIIPTVWFVLSTLSLDILKKYYMKK